MASVRIADKKVWVDDLEIPLLSGEIHYWRLDASNWRPVLERAREMGLQAGAQYTIEYTERRGSGCLTVIGLAPSTELLLAHQDQLHLKISGRALTAQVSTALFSRAGTAS
jgi:hypothetical protein